MLGLERGLEAAIGPVDTVCYVETEAFIIENLVRQMEQGSLATAPVWSNVKTFLPIAKRLRGKVDIITGGYPCQPFSTVGKQLGAADPRHLWPFIYDITDAIRPICCFFENVSNHLNLGYREVRHSLEALGYTVEEGIFSAEEIGAPHIRRRLFILAYANSARELQPFRTIVQGCRRSGNGGEEMGNADSDVAPEIGRDTGKVCSLSEEKCESKHSSIVSGGASLEMVNAESQPEREQVYEIDTIPKGQETRKLFGRGSFPMGQGYEQYGWEAARVESRMGFTVDGYNYREDLLRMAGNAVVEQTAELAFRTLMKKIFPN